MGLFMYFSVRAYYGRVAPLGCSWPSDPRIELRNVPLRSYLAKARHHGGEDLFRGDVVGEAIGVREEIALERGRVGREVVDERGVGALGGEELIVRDEASFVDRIGDVEDVGALRDGECDGVDVAAGDAGVDVDRGGWTVKAVFAGEEVATLESAEDEEGVARADGTGFLKLSGNRLAAHAGGDVNVDGVAIGGRAERSVDEPRGEAGGEEGEEEEETEKFHRGETLIALSTKKAKNRSRTTRLRPAQGRLLGFTPAYVGCRAWDDRLWVGSAAAGGAQHLGEALLELFAGVDGLGAKLLRGRRHAGGAVDELFGRFQEDLGGGFARVQCDELDLGALLGGEFEFHENEPTSGGPGGVN